MNDDIEAIKQLKARYFRMMDTKDWDGLAAVFTDDVEIDVAAESGGITRGAAEFLSFLRASIEDAITVHHGHMPEIELTSPTDGIRDLGAGRPTLVARRWTGFGHYMRPTRRPAPADGSSP